MAATRIEIIAVGKLKEKFWTDACAEYLMRLGRYATVNVVEVADQDQRFDGNTKLVLKAEAELLQKRIADEAYTVVLDKEGAQLLSEEFADLVVKFQGSGMSKLRFVIGGSWGVDDSIKEQADMRISFGPLTLPHNLARVVLLEQLYRCFRIIKGEPYHK